jgi:hypothetical protein
MEEYNHEDKWILTQTIVDMVDANEISEAEAENLLVSIWGTVENFIKNTIDIVEEDDE